MKRIAGAIALTAVGALLLAAALSLTEHNVHEAQHAAAVCERTAQELMEQITICPADRTSDLPVVQVEQTDYMGLLEIPGLDLTLPVMAQWDFSQLTNTPCRFSGSCGGRDLVICAHNYPGHFGPLLHIDLGEDVYLTSADSMVHHYVVSNREILSPESVEQMTDREAGEWDLTLFTCTLGGQTRCAVRCTLVSGEDPGE